LAVLAVQEIRRMRGGAQSHLMLCSDSHLYVVKFRNNPQHLRVLANELFASRLGEALGLTIPASEIVEVSDWLIQNTAELTIRHNHNEEKCVPGLQYGSRFIGGQSSGNIVVDYLPEEHLCEVTNLAEFAGILVFDKWTCNVNGRQAVFQKSPKEQQYSASFIDQGYCFSAGEWKFFDAPLRGVYPRNLVYRSITGWQSFEPWLKRVENFPEQQIWSIAESVPPEWYGDLAEMESLVKELLARRSRVRDLLDSFRLSPREPFPHWGKKEEPATAPIFPEPQRVMHRDSNTQKKREELGWNA
jgi:HipA-like protein